MDAGDDGAPGAVTDQRQSLRAETRQIPQSRSTATNPRPSVFLGIAVAALIALHPDTEQGAEILDEFEARFNIQSMQVIADGTRRYQLDAKDAEVDAFDSMLDKIDPSWRHHLTDWRDN